LPSLPKKIIKAIEQKFNHFLYNRKDEGIARVKVSWNMLCLPKKDGGLGIKKLKEWNHAAVMRHIWIMEFVCEIRVSLGCVGACSVVKGEELLGGSCSSSDLFLEFEEVVKA
jgi:hypothetical protein